MNFYKLTIISAALLMSVNSMAFSNESSYLKNVNINASTFHKNFSKGDFDKNAALVNDKIYVNSNAVISVGKEKFTDDIKRFAVSFPGMQVQDKITIFDGNQVGLLFQIQGQQKGQLGPLPATNRKVSLMGAEFFTMDKEAKLKELITITPAETMFGQLVGPQEIAQYATVTLQPNKKNTKPAYKQMLKDKMESFVDNFNVRNFNDINALFVDDVKVIWNEKQGTGTQAVIDGLNTFTKVLPDVTFHMERNLVDGDRGVIGYTIMANFIADKSKLGEDGQPVAKPVRTVESAFMKFNDMGKVTELIVVSDLYQINSQLKK